MEGRFAAIILIPNDDDDDSDGNKKGQGEALPYHVGF